MVVVFCVCGGAGEGCTTVVVIRGVVLRKHLVWSSDSYGLHSHIWHCLLTKSVLDRVV